MMNIQAPIQALQATQESSVSAFAVTRKVWLPLIETAETFLAEDEDHALAIAEDLKEELRILVGDEVGVGGSQALYNKLLVESWDTVSITPITITAVAPEAH